MRQRARKGKAHRKRRDRRAHFDELVQMDGSFLEWYQKREVRLKLTLIWRVRYTSHRQSS